MCTCMCGGVLHHRFSKSSLAKSSGLFIHPSFISNALNKKIAHLSTWHHLFQPCLVVVPARWILMRWNSGQPPWNYLYSVVLCRPKIFSATLPTSCRAAVAVNYALFVLPTTYTLLWAAGLYPIFSPTWVYPARGENTLLAWMDQE